MMVYLDKRLVIVDIGVGWNACGIASYIRPRKNEEQFRRGRVEAALGDDVSGEWLQRERIDHDFAGQRREVAVDLRGAGNGQQFRARTAPAQSRLIRSEQEGP